MHIKYMFIEWTAFSLPTPASYTLKKKQQGFPHGSVVKKSGKIPHTVEQPGLCTTAIEPWSRAWDPQLLSPCDVAAEAWVP